MVDLLTDGLAIVALTAESNADLLAFLHIGASHAVSGWIGRYVEADGRVIQCEVDMGYGPAAYYQHGFLLELAAKLDPISPAVFAGRCDLDWLESHHIHPTGWQSAGRRESLISSFEAYRRCVLEAAGSGRHLLVWNA